MMWDFTKSVLSFSWAMSLFGAQQVANLIAPSKAAKAFEEITQATEAELGNTLKAVFRAGDTLQRGLVDLTFGALPGGTHPPNRLTRPGSNGQQQSATSTQQGGQHASSAGWPTPRQQAQTPHNGGRPSPPPVSQVRWAASPPRSAQGVGGDPCRA